MRCQDLLLLYRPYQGTWYQCSCRANILPARADHQLSRCRLADGLCVIPGRWAPTRPISVTQHRWWPGASQLGDLAPEPHVGNVSAFTSATPLVKRHIASSTPTTAASSGTAYNSPRRRPTSRSSTALPGPRARTPDHPAELERPTLAPGRRPVRRPHPSDRPPNSSKMSSCMDGNQA